MILDANGNWIAGDAGNSSKRRWEAGQTTRLNEAHWSNADGLDINSDLSKYGQKLRQRTSYELANNAIIRGMVEQHKVDLVGADGPMLSVVVEDANNSQRADRYARLLEEVWQQWWESPTLIGDLHGADWLRQNVEMLWQNGEFLAQKVNDPRRGEPVTTRLHPLHPRKIGTGFGSINASAFGGGRNNEVILGLERNQQGKVTFYHIDDTPPGGSFFSQTRRIRANRVLHEFRRDEPGQLRGVPWLASVLQVAADLRDYDVQTLDAARQAADFAAMLVSNNVDIPPMDFSAPATWDIERRTVKTAPPGWDIRQLTPQQPSTQYVDYRRERHVDLGRPVSMPVMLVRGDSSKMNFSSARFDAQTYDRANAEKHAWLARTTLSPLLQMVQREAELSTDSALSPEDRPRSLRFVWTWGADTHRAADPGKEANAAKTRLETGLSTLKEELASRGKTLQSHVAELKREAEVMREAGVSLPEPTESRHSVDQSIRDVVRSEVKQWLGFEESEPNHAGAS